jgi:hypothetical protein
MLPEGGREGERQRAELHMRKGARLQVRVRREWGQAVESWRQIKEFRLHTARA